MKVALLPCHPTFPTVGPQNDSAAASPGPVEQSQKSVLWTGVAGDFWGNSRKMMPLMTWNQEEAAQWAEGIN